MVIVFTVFGIWLVRKWRWQPAWAQSKSPLIVAIQIVFVAGLAALWSWVVWDGTEVLPVEVVHPYALIVIWAGWAWYALWRITRSLGRDRDPPD